MGETIEMTADRKKGGALDRDDIKAMMLYVAEQVTAQEPFLTEIDLKVGDGDHGTGMKRGFMEVIRMLPEYEPSSPEDVFRFVGTTLLDTMGGASGVLFGTVFISGLTGRKEREFLELKDFADIFSKALQALKKRGRAKIGDKTMVDALEPAADGLLLASEKGADLLEGLKQAEEGAARGVEYTKTVKARFGRARYFGDKSIGLQDPGATSVWIIFRSMREWLDQKQKAGGERKW